MAKAEEKPLIDVFDLDLVVDEIGAGLDLSPVNLARGDFVTDCIPTGSLAFDLTIGGGWAPGRLVIPFGPEASGKSTFCYFAMKAAIKNKIPVFHFDHEGSADPLYMKRIGVKVDWRKESKAIEDWKKLPEGKDAERKAKKEAYNSLKPVLYRYYQPDTGEQVFRWIKRVLERMPDRDSGPVQAILFVDSLPAMLPEARDENDEKNPTAMYARMFSENLPLIKTKLAKKRVTLVATNQVRVNPRQMFGNPEYEMGGAAPKFYSDQRVKVRKCAIPGGTGYIEEEPCWDGNGIDRYMYTHLMTTKNKAFSPFRECHCRIWFEEAGQPGRGIDPVYDVVQYLQLTGQVEYNRGKYKIGLPGWENVGSLTWAEIKDIILNPEKNQDPNWQLYADCRSQIDDGSAFKLYFDVAGGVKAELKSGEDETNEEEAAAEMEEDQKGKGSLDPDDKEE